MSSLRDGTLEEGLHLSATPLKDETAACALLRARSRPELRSTSRMCSRVAQTSSCFEHHLATVAVDVSLLHLFASDGRRAAGQILDHPTRA